MIISASFSKKKESYEKEEILIAYREVSDKMCIICLSFQEVMVEFLSNLII